MAVMAGEYHIRENRNEADKCRDQTDLPPAESSPRGGRGAARLCSVYVSFSAVTAAAANEVITRTDDKLLVRRKDQLCHFSLCSLCVSLCV